VSLIFYRLHPVTVACWVAAYVICYLYDEPGSGDIVYGIAPLAIAGIGLGAAYLGGKIYSGIAQARARRKAYNQYLASDEYKALSAEQKKQARLLKAEQFGMPEAQKRRLGIETGKALQAQTGKLEADLAAGKADPTQRGQVMAGLQKLRDAKVDATVKSAGQAEAMSQQVGQAQRAQAVNTVKQAAAGRQALATQSGAISADKAKAIGQGITDTASFGLAALGRGMGPGADPRAEANVIGSGIATQQFGQTGSGGF
jgi:hypothetical protein